MFPQAQGEVGAIGNHNQFPQCAIPIRLNWGKSGPLHFCFFKNATLYFVLIWDKTNKKFTRGRLFGQTVKLLSPIWTNFELNMEMTQLPLLPPQAHLINSFILLLNCKIITCSKFINDYSILSDTKRLGVPQKINCGGNSCFMTGTEEVSFLLSIIILLFFAP